MNLRDLKYLITLDELGHFGKAARACFVSQPALSMQIKKLENTLGVQLIERGSKTILMTEAGSAIVMQAREILSRVNIIQEIAKQAQDPFQGELKLGVIPTLAPYLLPIIIPQVTSAFPKLTIFLKEEKTPSILTQLKQGELDAAIIALPVHEQELQTYSLFKEEFMLAVSRTHPLTKRKLIDYADLTPYTLYLLEEGHCMRENALTVCRIAKAKESSSFQATSIETLRHMVVANSGITLMPALACKIQDEINYLRFRSPKPQRTIGMVYRAMSARKILYKSLSEHIKQLLKLQKQCSVTCHSER